MTPNSITAINIYSLWESCQRTTFYVDLLSSEGFTITVASHRTGSVYTNFEGLSLEEARERALIDADTWGDFLGIVPQPYTADGVTYEPSMVMRPYSTQRILAARRKERGSLGDCHYKDGLHFYRGNAVYAVEGYPPECMQCGGTIPYAPENAA